MAVYTPLLYLNALVLISFFVGPPSVDVGAAASHLADVYFFGQSPCMYLSDKSEIPAGLQIAVALSVVRKSQLSHVRSRYRSIKIRKEFASPFVT